MSRLRHALDAIVFARRYTVELLDTIDPADWFRMPPGGATHVAWQVGHLAMSEFRLCLERVRGPRPDDAELFPPALLAAVSRQSVVSPDPAAYPAPAAIRAVFDRVHERVMADLTGWPDADLDSPILTAHRFCRTKIDAVRWCSAHEMLHAGQIGLLRRLFGHPPMW
ncbi:MAG: DinB family protein [Gemmataceae bacterium]|nr:DinB family protein [Gemmataceae bacterium]